MPAELRLLCWPFHNGPPDLTVGTGAATVAVDDPLLESLHLVCDRVAVGAAAITAYDPAFDADGRPPAAARRVAQEIGCGIRLQPTSDTS